jgi:hypothetical protein
MQKLEPLYPETFYLISQQGNNDEAIFPQYTNRLHFLRLIDKHLLPVCEVLDVSFRPQRVDLIVRIRPEAEIPERYSDRLHLPFSNLFNSYAKAMNKRYNRSGSLFRVRFERRRIDNVEMGV